MQFLTFNLCVCVCIQPLRGNERLHSGPQGPVHQHLHVHTLPAPAPPVQLRRPVWPTGPAAPQPLPTVPPAGAAAGGCRRPGAPGHTDAHRRWVRPCNTQKSIYILKNGVVVTCCLSRLLNYKLSVRFFFFFLNKAGLFIFKIKMLRIVFSYSSNEIVFCFLFFSIM